MAINSQAEETTVQTIAWGSLEQQSPTLLVDEIQGRLERSLGDDDPGVSLLIESLEEAYRDLILGSPAEDELIRLHGARQWLSSQRGKVAGYFQFLSDLQKRTDQPDRPGDEKAGIWKE